MKKILLISLITTIFLSACTSNKSSKSGREETNALGQPIYQDRPFVQDYSIKYYFPANHKLSTELYQVAADRNGNVQISSSEGLLFPYNGHLLASGTLLPVRTYRHMQDKYIAGVISYQNQFVYTDDNAVFSNAWAGSLYESHGLKKPAIFAGGTNFDFLVADGSNLVYLYKGEKVWQSQLSGITSIKFNETLNNFIIVAPNSILEFRPESKNIKTLLKRDNITCAVPAKEKIVVGTNQGYLWLDASGAPEGELISNVPWPEITDVEEINGELWFGSTRGAFKLNANKNYDYYASQRWLPDNNVVDIATGEDNSVLILTKTGLGQICFKEMTLHDKAMFLEKQTRKYHIRYGFSCSSQGMNNGSFSQNTLSDSDNDGLWTGMYLGGQLYRYAATKDPEAWENCKEALLGFERLYSITGVPGLPARAYEVIGYESSGYTNAFSEQTRHLFEESGYDVETSPWRNGTDKGWVWKSTTSSDEVLGHFYALSLFADIADDVEWTNRAKKLVVELAEHIYKNDLYLVDWNGKPTTWGKWHPDYVNGYDPRVGDRKLNSSNIIGFLQAGYHFTEDEKYKDKIFELFEDYGYLENLMRPMKEIGQVDVDDDNKVQSWAEMLSNNWNHSDDEMYFLGYWCLYPYALNDELREKYREAIRDHWDIERPEQDPAWNFTYAMTGAKEFDLDESIHWLKKHPIDHASWRIENSHRRDLEKLSPNFRGQFTKNVISPAEGVVNKHNGNRFALDRRGNGSHADTPGDVWLLPYWMGRYLDVISAPIEE
jgi:hypothetical protein